MTRQAKAILEEMICEMENYQEDRSDAWKESERGETFQETVEQLQSALDSLEAIPEKKPRDQS